MLTGPERIALRPSVQLILGCKRYFIVDSDLLTTLPYNYSDNDRR